MRSLHFPERSADTVAFIVCTIESTAFLIHSLDAYHLSLHGSCENYSHIYIYTKSPHPVLPRFKTLAHASKTRSSNKHIVIMQTCWVSYPADTHEDCLSPGHCHAQASLAACSKLRLNKLLDILRLSLSPQPRLNRQRIVMRRKLPARV